MCYLYDLVRTLGLSVIEIPLLATDYKLLTRLLLSNSSHKCLKKCHLYGLLVLWVCRIQNNFLFPIS
jgi:hypothetical protein